ncbi:hypothetical protein A2856_01010 [Candidatus Uhrbacteria bacterium RIFCSPHIGHO2_01_FULL_63_20]|uniref:DUF5667 domain-containing protein n=1 Tax=Candidatus Uhrbacteria bacterium RIFCSPHIGHO2_01_FULL_63_20 TaxID=1802385 RepID=A0A1F7TM50_9BACT|nr:MAG: hypothetical protein A2856_01010 [Candidatus Uhrbacteria bacterium RIFCSPHIGHO2_01_FULL_63_20]
MEATARFTYGKKEDSQPSAERVFASAELIEALEDEGSAPVEAKAPVVKESREPSLTDKAIDILYDELGSAKLGKHRAPDGTDLVVFPEDRLALALAVRDRAKQLVKILKQTGAEEGSMKEQMDLKRAESAIRDAEMLAVVGEKIWGVTETTPAVQKKLEEARAAQAERERASGEELERILAEKRARPIVDQAVSAEQVPSVSGKAVPSPFESSMPQEATGVHEVVPMRHVEDKDIVGSAEDFDELGTELAGAETELLALRANPEAPGRAERLQDIQGRAERLSMRTAEAGTVEPEGSPNRQIIQDLDFRATQLLLRTREALQAGKGEQPMNVEAVREVSESQIMGEAEPSLPERTIVQPDVATRISDTEVGPVPEFTRQQEMQTVADQGGERIATEAGPDQDVFATREEFAAETESEQTLVTPTIPEAQAEASVGPAEPTRINQPRAEMTQVTEPPTQDEQTKTA